MEQIILVRHGQTNKNVKGEIHAYGDNESLNDVGVDQIKKTAEGLRKFNPTVVYSSKGKRAMQSGKIIAELFGVNVESIDGMEERNWGDFSGKKWEEVEKVLNPMTLEERFLYHPPNGESWKEFESRLIKAIQYILSENKDRNIVVVSHGGAIRALMPYLLNMPREESFKYNPDTASTVVFSHDNGKFVKVE